MLVVECRRVVGCHRGSYQGVRGQRHLAAADDANLNPAAWNCDCDCYDYYSVAKWRRRRQLNQAGTNCNSDGYSGRAW